MSAILLWFVTVGVVGTAFVVLVGGYVMFHIGWAATCAASVLRWQVAISKANSGKVRWQKAPSAFLGYIVDFLGTDPGQITFSGPGGTWRGIGKWTVRGKQAAQRGREE